MVLHLRGQRLPALVARIRYDIFMIHAILLRYCAVLGFFFLLLLGVHIFFFFCFHEVVKPNCYSFVVPLCQ